MKKRFSIKDKIFDFCYRFKYGTIMFLVGIIVIFWDLLSKLITDGKTAEVINGFFRVESSHNPGGAWSLMGDHPEVLIVLSVLFLVFLLLGNWFFTEKSYFYAFAMGLVISGALGNLFDRIVYGKVRDFIKLEFIDFPTFNLADCAITVGVILLCFYFLFIVPMIIRKKEMLELKNQESSEETTTNNIVSEESQKDELIVTREETQVTVEDIICENVVPESEDKEQSLKENYNEEVGEIVAEKSSKLKRNRRTKLSSNNTTARVNRRKINAQEKSQQNERKNKKVEPLESAEINNEVVGLVEVQESKLNKQTSKQDNASKNAGRSKTKKEVTVEEPAEVETEKPVKKTTRKKVDSSTTKSKKSSTKPKTSTSKKVKEESDVVKEKSTKSGQTKKISSADKKTTTSKSTTKKAEKTESAKKLESTKPETKKAPVRKTTRAKKESEEVVDEIKPKTRKSTKKADAEIVEKPKTRKTAKTKKEVKDE